MLEMAIADFYAVNEAGLVKVLEKDGKYFILGDPLVISGTAYDKDEIEWAAITTVMDVQYVHE